jgi:carbonic anhydrase
MSVLDEVLAANEAFAANFGDGELPAPPGRHLAIVTCMDARIVPLSAFGLKIGDAHVLRNAGGRVTEDVLRSLLVSTHALGVREIAVVHHTECGMAKVTDEQLRDTIERSTGNRPGAIAFHPILDPDADLRADVARLTRSELLPEGTQVRGFEYDVRTGRLRTVV